MIPSQTTPTQRIIKQPEKEQVTEPSSSNTDDKLNEKTPRYDKTFPRQPNDYFPFGGSFGYWES